MVQWFGPIWCGTCRGVPRVPHAPCHLLCAITHSLTAACFPPPPSPHNCPFRQGGGARKPIGLSLSGQLHGEGREGKQVAADKWAIAQRRWGEGSTWHPRNTCVGTALNQTELLNHNWCLSLITRAHHSYIARISPIITFLVPEILWNGMPLIW